MTRKFRFAPGEYYHVFNRGIDKRNIFDSKEEKTRFQKLLYLCNGDMELDMRAVPYGSAFDLEIGRQLVSIGSYALMDNHFHLLLKELREGGISAFMQKLGTSHTMFFNLRNVRSGRLYEGPFKAVHIINDNHLRRLFSYIHLNPTSLLSGSPGSGKKANEFILKELRDFPFSSYQDHLGTIRQESKILRLKDFPKYFLNMSEYQNDMADWLEIDYEGQAFVTRS